MSNPYPPPTLFPVVQFPKIRLTGTLTVVFELQSEQQATVVAHAMRDIERAIVAAGGRHQLTYRTETVATAPFSPNDGGTSA